MELGDLHTFFKIKLKDFEVALLAIMELSDLRNFGFIGNRKVKVVAILAIMELGDLPNINIHYKY